MLGSRNWHALMRRNFIYRKRNIIGSLVELLLPVALIGVLVLIKQTSQKTKRFSSQQVPAQLPGDSDAFIPMSFGDYLVAMQARRECYLTNDTDYGSLAFAITGIPYKSQNWQVPFIKCDALYCAEEGDNAAQKFCEFNILAVASSSETDIGGFQRAKDFESYLLNRYPLLNTTLALETKNFALPFSFPLIQVFKSETSLERYVKRSEYGTTGYPKIAMGVVFNGNSSIKYDYKLRQNSTNFYPSEDGESSATTTPDPSRLFTAYAKGDSACSPSNSQIVPNLGNHSTSCTHQYIYNGVLVIQRLVNDFILDNCGAYSKDKFVAEHGVAFVSFPSQSYVINGFYANLAPYIPLPLIIGLLYPVAAIIGSIVREKETRQKELMMMMSVTESDIQWSWFVSYACFHLVTATCTFGACLGLYLNSDRVLLWIFWMLTFLVMICFSMTMAAFSSNSTRATIIGLVVFVFGYFLTLLGTDNLAVVELTSLHPVAVLSYGLRQIGDLEDKVIGLNFSTWDSTDGPINYTFKKCLESLVLDSVLWGFLSWYLNRVIPSDYGQCLTLSFPFHYTYWCPNSIKALPRRNMDHEVVLNDSIPMEPVSDALKAQARDGKCIEICGLTKRYGDKVAVDRLNLLMYNGQITGLLGHNGAGKTTLINILTGMISPSGGYAKISGVDVRTGMGQIRQSIGVCLQHDCLFPLLTVKEHLQFFARVKGVNSRMSFDEAQEMVNSYIHDVALTEKSECLAKNLSGGMMRKLSVAIAFCGDSMTVLLDEPTAGMDPFSRRFTWNVIRKYRPGRTIILTTHFMDEADILSDRIAIMTAGTLQCVGSPLFLKKTYGLGYQLIIEHSLVNNTSTTTMSNTDPLEIDATNENDNATTAFDVDYRICNIVTGASSEAKRFSSFGKEIIFQLPLAASSNFYPMFEALDREVLIGTITTYGLSITTLQDVFLLAQGDFGNKSNGILVLPDETSIVSATERGNEMVKNSSTIRSSGDYDTRVSRKDIHAVAFFVVHFIALFRKRAINFMRDRKAWLFTIVLPTILVLLGFLVFHFTSRNRDLVEVKLMLDDYNVAVKVGPRNPIPFNPSGTRFTCQPGDCSFRVADVLPNGESYQYCGIQARLDISGLSSCSISESTSIIQMITEFGALPIPSNASDIQSSSFDLVHALAANAATRYGYVYFTHDRSSVMSDGRSFSAEIVKQCLHNPLEYLPLSECHKYGGIGYVIGYNYSAPHVAPLYQTLVDEAIAKDALATADFTITTTIHPLPITEDEMSYANGQDAFTAWFLLVLSFPFIAGTFATFIVTERECKAKQLQKVAGVSPYAYWISTYCWDIANYQIPLWITVSMMFACNVTPLTTTASGVLGGVLAILFLYGPASAGCAYCASFFFTSPGTGSIFVIVFNFVTGMVFPLAQFLLRNLGTDPFELKPDFVRAANILEWCLRFFPSFCLGNGIIKAIFIRLYQSIKGEPITVWDTSVLFYEVIFLLWESVGYVVLAIIIDISTSHPRLVGFTQKVSRIISCHPIKNSTLVNSKLALAGHDDEDVLREQERVVSGAAIDDLIVLNQLTKAYNTGKVAVDNLSLGIPAGQCFGLLGINGAGKTTTMSMLTAECPPTCGDVFLAGHSICNEPEQARRRIGYCPQFDAHFQNMTGREHVEFYAYIRGIPATFVREAAEAKLNEVGITERDRDVITSRYSGGVKRRLSLACATIGEPQIVFLDECSTGVDPVARREIRQVIFRMIHRQDLSEHEKPSVILTTHSMEECEALCPRIGIMANGRLRCLGSAQHLKAKFGQGYQVELATKTVNSDDGDYHSVALRLYHSMHQNDCDEEAFDIVMLKDVCLDLSQVRVALQRLLDDEQDFMNFRHAYSEAGVALLELASFATSELRIRRLHSFMIETYPDSILNERQDNKVRYELSKNFTMSNIFSSIEENKDSLMLAYYGVSQTSLEQVFNFHAAQAEELKQSRST